MDLHICYGCGLRGHIQRECHSSRQGTGRGTAQPSSSAAATSSAPPLARGPPALAGRGAARGGAQGSGGPNRFYGMSGRQSVEASPDVFTGMLTVQYHDVYALIELGSTFSYVTPFVAMEFGIEPEQLPEPFSISTPVGESIVVARVYRGCVVTVRGRDTMDDLIELGMKAVKFQWSDAYERSFQELKSRLTTAPLLTLPEGTDEFVIYCDASRIGLGCVLMQHGKDYDIDILYHPEKANVVVDALSRKSMGSLAHLEVYKSPLAKEVHRLASSGVRLAGSSEGGVIVQNRAESSLVVEVNEKQYNDPFLVQLKEGIQKHKTMAFALGMDDGTLRYQGKLCVSNVDGLRERIMTEAHASRYSVHPGSTKMYHDLK
ncbi:uncharacterized protein [Nicotiana tomentosiformis]|uniref:uncharacterized protein n=1 Tax=Nicotiana tomentosiformis TaxID=4098 RepID=UPI00388C699D